MALVTRDTFREAAGALEAELASCAFCAFDCEMTGITADDSLRPQIDDTPSVRYAKASQIANKFQLMQVGVCPFHESEEGQFSAKPYTFYVLPDAESNVPILMYTPTVAFHVKNDFDFNTWLKLGVPYLSETAYATLAARLDAAEEPSREQRRERVVLSADADRAFFAAAIDDLKAWLKRQREEEPGGGEGCGEGGKDAAAGRAEENFHMLPECNAFLRRAFYEELQAEFPECVVESRTVEDTPPLEAASVGTADVQAAANTAGAVGGAGGGPGGNARSSGGKAKRRMVVMKLTEAQKAERAAAKRAAKLVTLNERAGFLRVWRALCRCGKPLVGHNCLFDLLFMYAAFEGPLPPTLSELKAALTSRMGRAVRDTKALACDSGLFSPWDTALGPLRSALTTKTGAPVCQLGASCERYLNTSAEHEAGFDAYLTGCCFAVLRALGHAPPASCGRLHLNNSLFALQLHDEADGRFEPQACVLHLALPPQPQAASSAADAASSDRDAARPQPVRTHDVLTALEPLQAQVRVRWFNDAEAFVWLTVPPNGTPRSQPTGQHSDCTADAAAGASAPLPAPPMVDQARAMALLTPLGVTVGALDDWLEAQQRKEQQQETEGQAPEEGGGRAPALSPPQRAADAAAVGVGAGDSAGARPKGAKRAREAAAGAEEEQASRACKQRLAM